MQRSRPWIAVAVVLAAWVVVGVAPRTRSALAAGPTLDAVAGQPFSGVVATFTGQSCSNGCDATVDWSDGTLPTQAPASAADHGGGVDVSATHTYARAGQYRALVTLHTCTQQCLAGPQTSTVVVLVTVTAAPPSTTAPSTPTTSTTVRASGGRPPVRQSPAVGFQATGDLGVTSSAGHDVVFTAPALAATGRAIHHYLWDFGDGTRSRKVVGGLKYRGPDQPTTVDHVTHRYRVPGVYAVHVSATDEAGATTSLGTHVSVGCIYYFQADSPGPKASAACPKPPATPLFPLMLKFTDDPVANETVTFTLPAAQDFKATPADAILKVIGTDPAGNPIFSGPLGTPGQTNTPMPSFTVDFGDGSPAVTDASPYPYDGIYPHAYATPGVYHVVATMTLQGQSEVINGIVHVEGGNGCDTAFVVAGYDFSAEGSGCFRRVHIGNGVEADPNAPGTDGPRYYLTSIAAGQRADHGGAAFSAVGGSLLLDPFTGSVTGGQGVAVDVGPNRLTQGGGVTLAADSSEMPLVGGTATVGGFRIASGTLVVPRSGSVSVAGATLALPDDFHGATTEPVELPFGALGGQPAPLTVGLPAMEFGPVQITSGSITRQGALWSGSIQLVLFDGPAIGGSLAFDGAGHVSAASIDDPVPVPIAGPVTLDGVHAQLHLEGSGSAFSFEANPATLSIVDPDLLAVQGCFGFAYVHAGESATVCGSTLTSEGAHVRATGNVTVGGALALGNASAFFDSSPFAIGASGHYDQNLLGLADISGDVSIAVTPPGFSAQGAINLCIDIIGCTGGAVAFNQNGVAACASISVVVGDLHGDLWARWHPAGGGVSGGDGDCGGIVGDLLATKLASFVAPGGDPSPTGDGLAVQTVAMPRRARGGVAAATAVQVPKGMRGVVFELTGSAHSPRVVVNPPSGAPIADTGAAVQNGPNGVVILHGDGGTARGADGRVKTLPDSKTTYVSIPNPAPGPWTVASADGSPVASVQRVLVLPAPRITGRVAVGGGRRNTLAWSLLVLPGQKVTFHERADGIDHVLGSTRRASGHLVFSPADGAAGTRRVVAEVTEDGLPRTTVDLTTFAAPSPIIPHAPRVAIRLHAARARLEVGWKPVPSAARYAVDVRLTDGRRIIRSVGSRVRSIRVDRFHRGTGVTASVLATTAGGRSSPPTTRTIRASSRVRVLAL